MAENAFCDDVYLSKAQKDALFTEWQRFVKSGFHPLFLTQRLYQHLVECGLEVHGRERLWQTFFNGEAVQFRRLLEMFAGDRRSLASGDHAWLQGPGWDLNLAMCDLMTPLYPPLLYLLDELERYHNELTAGWHEFATLSGVAAVSPPASYRLEANTRSLMQLAIQAALAQKQPLIGLQLQLPQAVTYG